MSEKKPRMTEQRYVILDELTKTDTHPTADEVYEMVRRRLPRISLSTVYRNLVALPERGLVRKLDVACSRMRFDGELSEHYHVRCERCDRVCDVPVACVGRLTDAVTDPRGFKITGFRLEFVGVCPACSGTGGKE